MYSIYCFSCQCSLTMLLFLLPLDGGTQIGSCICPWKIDVDCLVGKAVFPAAY